MTGGSPPGSTSRHSSEALPRIPSGPLLDPSRLFRHTCRLVQSGLAHDGSSWLSDLHLFIVAWLGYHRGVNKQESAAEAESRNEEPDGSGGSEASDEPPETAGGGKPTGEQQAAANRAVDPPA